MSATLEGTGHPSRFGYARCFLCLCWRPESETRLDGIVTCATPCSGVGKFTKWAESAPFLPHAGSPVATGLDENGDAL